MLIVIVYCHCSLLFVIGYCHRSLPLLQILLVLVIFFTIHVSILLTCWCVTSHDHVQFIRSCLLNMFPYHDSNWFINTWLDYRSYTMLLFPSIISMYHNHSLFQARHIIQSSATSKQMFWFRHSTAQGRGGNLHTTRYEAHSHISDEEMVIALYRRNG